MTTRHFKWISLLCISCLTYACSDNDASSSTKDQENTSATCQDGIDNDGNGKLDCDDEGCKDFAFCAAPEDGKENTLIACQDKIDNDGDGKIDCNDDDCKIFDICKSSTLPAENTEETCKDNIDNDGNGKIDCEEISCLVFEQCAGSKIEENTYELCTDNIDNNGNGKIDCEEISCKSFDICIDGGKTGENTYETCRDGLDNDADGKTDCADPECQEYEFCLGVKSKTSVTKETCQDGLDNDGDGLIDCADPDCQTLTDVCSDECPDDPYKYKPDQCPCGETWVPDDAETITENGGTCQINLDKFEDLEKLSESVDGSKKRYTYILKKNIDAGEVNNFTPFHVAMNSLNGNHKRLSGIFHLQDKKQSGIFDRINSTFENLKLAVTLNVYLKSRTSNGGYIGSLTGLAQEATLKNITGTTKVLLDNTDKKAVQSTSYFVGGLLGIATDSHLKNITLDGNVSADIAVSQSEEPKSDDTYDTSVGGLVGYIHDTSIQNVDTNINVTVLQKILHDAFITKEATETDEEGSRLYGEPMKAPHIHVGGIVGTQTLQDKELAENGIRHINAKGSIKVDAAAYVYNSYHYCDDYNGYLQLKLNAPDATFVNVGGIAGTGIKIENAAFTGDITIYPYGYHFSEENLNLYNYCTGGVIGATYNYDMTGIITVPDKLLFDELYANSLINVYDSTLFKEAGSDILYRLQNDITNLGPDLTYRLCGWERNINQCFDCGEKHSKTDVKPYIGGLIGCFSESKQSFLVNSSANTKLMFLKRNDTTETSYLTPHAHNFRYGGLANITNSNSSDKTAYIVNNYARTVLPFEKWHAESEETALTDANAPILSGISATNTGKFVNNFISGVLPVEDKTHAGYKYYKKYIQAAGGAFLYESYWNEDVFDTNTGSKTVDASAKPYLYNDEQIPVTTLTKDSVLNLLRKNSGHNGGVLSANIPKYTSDTQTELYIDWHEITDEDGHKVPVPSQTNTH